LLNSSIGELFVRVKVVKNLVQKKMKKTLSLKSNDLRINTVALFLIDGVGFGCQLKRPGSQDHN